MEPHKSKTSMLDNARVVEKQVIARALALYRPAMPSVRAIDVRPSAISVSGHTHTYTYTYTRTHTLSVEGVDA